MKKACITQYQNIQITLGLLKFVNDDLVIMKIVSENYQEIYNHKLQTNPWHRDEEPHNNYETQGKQTKSSNQLSLSFFLIR